MSPLLQIQESVRLRTETISSTQTDWPCRKGCDDCCRHLASTPRVSRQEWQAMAAALDALPAEIADAARDRIRNSALAVRPVVCPLLDTASGTCLVYEARPVACRAYGFYSERRFVLGCSRIEAAGEAAPGVVWGNHTALQEELRVLGPAASLDEWLISSRPASRRRNRPRDTSSRTTSSR
jgi:Fe-S-cluster containining protein